MQPTKKNADASASKNIDLGQIIACAVALIIMGLGAWSLLGQKAPYHPEGYEGEVTRGSSDLTDVRDSD